MRRPTFRFLLRLLPAALLMGVVLRPAPSTAQFIFFEDDFNGSSVDTTKWNVTTNGYPAPAVVEGGGFLSVGTPMANSTDFPYITNVPAVFPASEGFRLDLVMQYTGVGQNGDGFVVLGPANEEIFSVWRDLDGNLFVQLNAGEAVPISAPTATHQYSLTVKGFLTLEVDGVIVLVAPIEAWPTRLWFGHPTIGQVFSTAAYEGHPTDVTPAGVVTARWGWSYTEWSTFRLDLIRVTVFPAVPTMSAGGLAATVIALAGVGCLLLARRRVQRA